MGARPMDETISAAEANRQFSRILREVQAGTTYVVAAHGRPVARIAAFNAEQETRAAAWAALMTCLDHQPAIDIGPWTRGELYDD